MTTTLLLLAAFLAIVVAGGTLVALHDALERAWSAAARGAVGPAGHLRRTPARRAERPAVAWRHLH
jgi:hypothetical protein